MQLAITALVGIVLMLLWQIPVVRVCTRNRTLAKWQPLLMLMAVAWGAFFIVRIYLTGDNYVIKTDAVFHESMARQIAEYLRAGDFQSAFSFFGVGNPAFQFAVGVFYAVT